MFSSINIPKLEYSDYFNIQFCSSLTSINVSSLKTCNSINIGSTSITTIDLSNLLVWDLRIYNNSSLTSINISGLSSFGEFYADQNSLSSEAINGLLAHFVAITPSITGKTIHLNNQTPLAPPTGQGITDKATLIANGNTVETD